MGNRRSVPAVVVKQWLTEWSGVRFPVREKRREPDKQFYVFSLPADILRSLTGIQRRAAYQRLVGRRDLGIQRRHEPSRSAKIADYVHYGFPWSDLSPAKRKDKDFAGVQMPGWLPTAIIVNLIGPRESRSGMVVETSDQMEVTSNSDGTAKVRLPASFSGDGWKPTLLYPLEIIDGQHRLWAFGEHEFHGEFEFPVVAFDNLDISWQAYLFWTINIKPKRINPSLAIDLHPLLRTVDWLERDADFQVFRASRAQELVQALWATPSSPWYQQINMLGEPGEQFRGMVSQATWVRSLLAAFIKGGRGGSSELGGLFGGRIAHTEAPLPWTSAQEAAFLVCAGVSMRDAVGSSRDAWAVSIRRAKQWKDGGGADPAFYGETSLLTTDPGLRGFWHIVNDLVFLAAEPLELESWRSAGETSASSHSDVEAEWRGLDATAIPAFLRRLSSALSHYDWRTSADPGLSEIDALRKKVLRGSGGYREMRRALLTFLAERKDDLGARAAHLVQVLGYGAR
jgi:hypothetical protein